MKGIQINRLYNTPYGDDAVIAISHRKLKGYYLKIRRIEDYPNSFESIDFFINLLLSSTNKSSYKIFLRSITFSKFIGYNKKLPIITRAIRSIQYCSKRFR